MITILQKNNPILRKTTKPVPIKNITSPEIKRVIHDMKEAMHSEEDAVAIAAPQIGILLRIFVVSGVVFKTDDIPVDTVETKLPPDIVLINPEIIKLSQKKQWTEEGCLSVRWWYGDVERAEKATVRAYDEDGKIFTRGASGLLAQIFQHEIDHLSGILFTDKARKLTEILPKKNKEAQ